MLPALLGLALVLAQPAPAAPDGGSVVIKGQRFMAEVARLPPEQARGLMYRQSLAKDRCMFFLYEEDDQRAITMRNCLIALDVLFVAADGTVVDMGERVPPPSPVKVYRSEQDYPHYISKRTSRHFVELPAGTVQRLKLKVGDRIGWALHLSDGRDVAGGLPVPKEAAKGRGRAAKGKRK